MNFFATIEVDDPEGIIEKLFKDEKGDRSSTTITKKDEKLVFTIKANDSVALRATLNSITKLFTVYENMASD